jgi:hypothetical protein
VIPSAAVLIERSHNICCGIKAMHPAPSPAARERHVSADSAAVQRDDNALGDPHAL